MQFSSTDTQAALPGTYTFTAADNGTHAFSATLNSTGNQTVAATDTIRSTIAGTSNTITVSTASPPSPVQIVDDETITVTDAASFPDVFDAENVKVSDQVTVYAFFPIAISPAPPILSAVLTQPYSAVTFSGSGGYQGLSMSESGVVPGMSFAISGASASFSGTPTQNGTFPFTITETDAIGNKLSQSYSLTVSATCPAISVSPSGSLGAVTVSSPFSQAFVASGKVGATTWSTTSALPAGMNFSGGVLSESPAQSGAFA